MNNSIEKETFPQYFNEDYDVIGILGRGGMGTVYKAIHKNLNREVALKVLEKRFNDESDEAVKRFNLEAQAMKKLDHQNIVQVYDFGREGDQFFIAMTYATGITLSDLLHRRKKLDVDEALLIIKQVARGLRYAHNKGIIHRDIKPSNIIISPDNRVYITDFGISYVQDSDRLTNTGTAMGTPEYMSPEQCQGEEITLQSDIYSLGIIFYEMLCGEPPFTGVKPLDIAYKQVHNHPEAPTVYRGDINPDLENVLLKCLEKNRANRYNNIDEFLRDIDKLHAPPEKHSTLNNQFKSLTKKIPSIIQRKKHTEILFPIALGIIALLTVMQVALVFFQSKPQGIHIVDNFEVSAPYEQRNLEKDQPNGYPLKNLWDNKLQTAWLAPVSKNNPIIITIRFPQPMLITSIGYAVGYQKVKDDEFQDRFAMFQKPQNVVLKTESGSKQKVKLQNLKGMQYPTISPIETQVLYLEFKDTWPAMNPNMNLALSELRILGIKLP